jgi:uncharacterized Rmd1/YagE family protein
MSTIDARLEKLKREVAVENLVAYRDELFSKTIAEQHDKQYVLHAHNPEQFRQSIIEYCALNAYRLREMKKGLKKTQWNKVEQEMRAWEYMAKFMANVRINV